MKISKPQRLLQKELIVFDLDGTLIRTKSPMDSQMSQLIGQLLAAKKVAIIGGGKYTVFQELFIKRLKANNELLKNLFLFPTTSTAFYKYNKGWKQVYSHQLSRQEVTQITKAFEDTFKEIGYKHPAKTYGKIIENRGTQVSFSVFGQDLVTALGNKGVRMKEQWLKNNLRLKMKIANLVQKKLPKFSVKAAGFTTIDVTKKGIDKAYGVRQIQKHLKIPIAKMLFVGDAIFPGGNDYAALKTGIDYVKVEGPEETKKIIGQLTR
ncbi:MAG: HAD-IIB family hydrolase [Candidatus Doudnabacteria bacterium]|nr:HAD-IIB family hydrolase [Candidatus Doudnabacteria bacterium]